MVFTRKQYERTAPESYVGPQFEAGKMAMKVRLVEIDNLIPYANNARTHSDEQVAQIEKSIQEYGFNNPILVDSEQGIIAGHGRFKAAQNLGLTHVPVIILDHLSDAQKRAYIIADNKIAENAGWDEDLLRDELLALNEDDIELPDLGFSDEELSELLPPGVLDGSDKSEQNDEKADEVPEVAENELGVERGDIYLFNPRYECDKCGKVFSYEQGKAGATCCN